MVNCDDIGDVWITRLSESEVVVIADGDLYGNNIVALPKGEPTKVQFNSHQFIHACIVCVLGV